MTKPLIQQLAERARFTNPSAIAQSNLNTYELACIVFELCAWLDERTAKERNPGWFGDILDPSRVICARCSMPVRVELADAHKCEPPVALEQAPAEPDASGLYHDRPHVDLPGQRIRCEPDRCHKYQSQLIAERDASAARVKELEAQARTKADAAMATIEELSLTKADLAACRAELEATKQNAADAWESANAEHQERIKTLAELKLIKASREDWKKSAEELQAELEALRKPVADGGAELLADVKLLRYALVYTTQEYDFTAQPKHFEGLDRLEQFIKEHTK